MNVSGRIYDAVQYGLDDNGYIDYNQAEELALEHKPKLIITGFSAYSRIVDWERFREIADKVGALMMADIAHVAGLIATGEYPSPVQIADVTTSTTHKTLRGPRSGIIMGKANEDIQKKINFMVFPAYQGGPHMHTIAAKAVAFKECLEPEFKGSFSIKVLVWGFIDDRHRVTSTFMISSGRKMPDNTLKINRLFLLPSWVYTSNGDLFMYLLMNINF